MHQRPPGDRNSGVVIGVDVGGTKVAVASVDGVTVRESSEDPTDVATTERLLDGIEGSVRRMIERVGEPDAIGLGVPSQIDYATGTVETSVNIPLTGVPSGARLFAVYHCGTRVRNTIRPMSRQHEDWRRICWALGSDQPG